MKTYKKAVPSIPQPTVCALGCFDGVHLGHSAIICEAKRAASLLSLPTAVWSFAQPPKSYFGASIPLLTTAEEKHMLMRKLGVDIYVSVPFDKNIAGISAADFFNTVLLGQMQARHIVCGFNYRFGKGGEGDTRLLQALCDEHGIGLSVMPPVMIEGETVSSTLIRQALTEGKPETASRYLGRAYSLCARITDGQHLGRTLGFPTINQSFPQSKLVPAKGVYVSRVQIGRKKYYGITNIGLRPTVEGKEINAETNIFDFSGDLYGKRVKVEFLSFLRGEKKFTSLELLSKQVHSDIASAKEYVNSIIVD